MRECSIPKPTVRRLLLYLRCLKSIDINRRPTISSKELANVLGINPNQVRKDLSYFGQFGKRGVGYSVVKLRESLERIAGISNIWNMAIVGMGNLGKAILNYYEGTEEPSLKVVAVFDKDRRKIGKRVGKRFKIRDIKHFPSAARRLNIDIVLLTVPPDAAQDVVDVVIKGKIKGILNFSTTHIKVPKDVFVEDADINIFLRVLIFSIIRQEQCV